MSLISNILMDFNFLLNLRITGKFLCESRYFYLKDPCTNIKRLMSEFMSDRRIPHRPGKVKRVYVVAFRVGSLTDQNGVRGVM